MVAFMKVTRSSRSMGTQFQLKMFRGTFEAKTSLDLNLYLQFSAKFSPRVVQSRKVNMIQIFGGKKIKRIGSRSMSR